MFNPRVKQAFDFYVQKGYNPSIAAGLVGNLMAESGADLNPQAYNKAEDAFGLAQWTPSGGRKAAVLEYMRANGMNPADFDSHLNAVHWELQGPEKRAMQKLQGVNDPRQAAALVDQYYERSAGIHRDKRMDYAQQIFDAYGQDIDPMMAQGGPADGTLMDQAVARSSSKRLPIDLSNMPVTEDDDITGHEGNIMLRENPEGMNISFNPNNAIQSIGAAIASGSQGESAASALSSIRNQHFRQQAQLRAENKAQQEQQALAAMLKDHPDLLAAQQAGAGMDAILPILMQRSEQQHTTSERIGTQDWRTGERIATQEYMKQENETEREYQDRMLRRSRDWDLEDQEASRAFQLRLGETEHERDLRIQRLAQEHEAGQAELQRDFLTSERIGSQDFSLGRDEKRRSWEVEDRDIDNQIRKAEFDENNRIQLKMHGDNLDISKSNLEVAHENLKLRKEQIDNDYRFNTDSLRQRKYEFDTEHELRMAEAETAREDGISAGEAFQTAIAGTLETLNPELAAQLAEMPPEAFSKPGMQSAMTQIIGQLSPDDTLPTSIQEFLAMQKMPPEMADEFLSYKRSGVAIDTPADTFKNEEIKNDFKVLKTIQEEVLPKQKTFLDGIRRIQQLFLENPEVAKGAILGDENVQYFRSLAHAAGVPGLDSVPDEVFMTQLVKNLVPGMREVGSGTSTDRDMVIYEKSLPSTANDPQSFEKILDFHVRSAERDLAYNEYISQISPEVSMSDRRASWEKLAREGDPVTRPAIVNLNTFKPENIAAYERNYGELQPNDPVIWNNKVMRVEDANLERAKEEMRRRKQGANQ